jgi:hypothetical protein
MKTLKFWVFTKWFRVWFYRLQRNQLVRRRQSIAKHAGDRIMQSPYNAVFSLIDRELVEIDAEINDITSSKNYWELYQKTVERMADDLNAKYELATKDFESFVARFDKDNVFDQQVLDSFLNGSGMGLKG